jgi:pentatricopeptide repeat protein
VAGRLNDCLSHFKQLMAMGIEHDLITYNLLIHGLGKSRRLEEAVSLYNDMEKK